MGNIFATSNWDADINSEIPKSKKNTSVVNHVKSNNTAVKANNASVNSNTTKNKRPIDLLQQKS